MNYMGVYLYPPGADAVIFLLVALSVCVAIWVLAHSVVVWLDRRKRKQASREFVQRVNRQAPYKVEQPAKPDGDDLLMWPSGVVILRKDFHHSADIEKYGHTYIIVQAGTSDHQLVMNNLRHEPTSLETTEDEATL